MRQGTKDALLATGLAVAITGLITWRDIARSRARASAVSPPDRGAYR